MLKLQSERGAKALHQTNATSGSMHQPPHWLFQDDNELLGCNPWLAQAISFASDLTRIEQKYI
jgi:hypothetical protein